jgi:putative phosphoribosyl transferase
MRFRDRSDAGRQLAGRLAELHLDNPLVLGLPRGGVPVAAEVGDRLSAPVEVFVARKVGAPGHEELGIGAVAEGWDGLVVTDSARLLGLDDARMGELAEQARREVQRRVESYRGGRKLPELSGRDVILVDDGLATGVTAEAALRALLARRPGSLSLAVPTCAKEAAARLAELADRVVCVMTPREFFAVGQCYDEFEQTTDEEVAHALARGRVTVARSDEPGA